MRNRLTATMRKGIQRRRRPHFNTRRARLGVCWTRQQSVMRSAMSSHLHRFNFQQQGHLTEVGFFSARTWLTLDKACEFFPPKD